MNYSALLVASGALFTLVIIGVLLNRLHIVDDEFTKKLSTFVSKAAQPFMIIYSVVKLEYSAQNLKYGLMVTGIGILSHAAMAVFAFFAFRWIRDCDERKLTEFGFVFSNCAFFGYPVLESLFGDVGLFYGAFYVIAFNVVMWSYGVALMARGRQDIKFRLRNIFLNVGWISCAIGLGIYIARIPIPNVMIEVMKYMAALCTPLALIVTGSLLASIPLRRLLTKWQLYVYCLLKLIAFPLCMAVICKLVGLDRIDCGINIALFIPLMCSIPPAAFTSIFAGMYGVKPPYAGHLVALATLMSPITIPIVVRLSELILSL